MIDRIFWSYVKRMLRRQENVVRSFDAYIPTPLYSDDVFLVSYPKSGNTWLRFLVANLLFLPENGTIDFHSIQSLIPEVIRNNDAIDNLKRPRIIKSHAFKVKYPRTIYVLRDGRDVYLSYYFYRKNKLSEYTSFADFLKASNHYPCRWSQHVNFWLQYQEDRENFLLIRYEDMISDIYKEVYRILNFLRIEKNDQQIQQAVLNSSFDNMRRIEIEKGRPYKQQEGADIFVRRGEPGNWKNYFGSTERDIFNEYEGRLLVDLGYAQSLAW